MKKHAVLKGLITASVAALCASLSQTTLASAFQLFEQNAVNMGDFGAGGAAIANDASTAYSNPAGLIRIPNQQIVISGDMVITDMRFNGVNVWSTPVQTTLPSPPAPAPIQVPTSFTASGIDHGGTANLIPALHYAAPISDTWAFGFSIASPFGLSTNYGTNSLLSYSASETQLDVIDISPDLAAKLTNHFSLGGGVDFEHIDATFNSVGGLPTLSQVLSGGNPNTLNSLSENEATAWGTGWHVGALYQVDDGTRIGATFRSLVHFVLNGTSKFLTPANSGSVQLLNSLGSNFNSFESTNLKARVTLPPSEQISLYHEITSRWAVDVTGTYTQWNIFNRNLTLQNIAAINVDPTNLLFSQTIINATTPENFHNTWRVAVGTEYKINDQWLIRAGTGYDQSPVPGNTRNVRLPDANRIGLAIGAHFQATKTLGFDAGWTHLFMPSVGINNAVATGQQTSTAIGTFHNTANLFGAQVTWDMV